MSELIAIRRKLRMQAISVGLAVAPFGAAFGALCTEAGLGTWEALGFSSFVFGGSSQFAAVTVLAEGGTIIGCNSRASSEPAFIGIRGCYGPFFAGVAFMESTNFTTDD